VQIIVPEHVEEIRNLWQEAKELNLILNAIYKKVNSKLT